VPIVTEKDENGQAYLPTFLNSKVYVDFASGDGFETDYEKLLRNLYKRPALSKPKLGSAPAYLFEDTPVTFKTTALLRTFDAVLDRNPMRIRSISKEFLESLFENIQAFTIVFQKLTPIEVGKDICESLNQYAPLKADFVNFIDRITKNETNSDTDDLINFFEKLPSLLYPQTRKNFSNWEFDNFRFIIHELFLSMIATALKNSNYRFLETVLQAPYYIDDKYSSHRQDPDSYAAFYMPIDDTIKGFYNATYSQNFYSPSADLMVKRTTEPLNGNIFVEADLLCYYVTL